MEGLASLNDLVGKLSSVPGIQATDVVSLTSKWFGAYHAYLRKASVESAVTGGIRLDVPGKRGKVPHLRAPKLEVDVPCYSDKSVQHDVGFGVNKASEDSLIRDSRDRAQSPGYCYLRAIRANYHSYASRRLGSRPAFSALLAAPVSWFRPLQQLRELRVSGSSPVWHLSLQGDVDLLSVLGKLSCKVINEPRNSLCASVKLLRLNIQDDVMARLSHTLGFEQAQVEFRHSDRSVQQDVGSKVDELGRSRSNHVQSGGTDQHGLCYLRAILPRCRRDAFEVLGYYPTLSALLSASASWFEPFGQLRMLGVSGISPVWHLSTVGDVDLLSVLLSLSLSSPRAGSDTMCGKLQRADLNIQGVTGFFPHHILGASTVGASRFDVVDKYPVGYCYLHLVEERYVQLAATMLGNSPKLSAIVDAPAIWFISNRDFMAYSIIVNYAMGHLVLGDTGVDALHSLLYAASKTPCLRDLSLAERLLTARIGVPAGFSVDVQLRLGMYRPLAKLGSSDDRVLALSRFDTFDDEFAINFGNFMLGQLGIDHGDIEIVYGGFIKVLKREYTLVNVNAAYDELRVLRVPGPMDCIVYQVRHQVVGWLPISSGRDLLYGPLTGKGVGDSGIRGLTLFPVPSYILPVLQACVFKHVVGHMNSEYEELRQLFNTVDLGCKNYHILASKFVDVNSD